MATLCIVEYSVVTGVGGGSVIQAAKVPPLATQKVSFTTATSSTRFQDSTTFIRVVSDADAYIEFGTDPTATSSSMLLPSGVVEYFGIDLENAPLLSVYDGSS